MTTISKENLTREAEAIANEWIEVATNEGTFGPTEGARLIGTGDPAYTVYKVWECVGTGAKRIDNKKSYDAGVGRERRINSAALSAKKERLAELRKAINAK